MAMAPFADLYELTHPAVDACVADLLQNFKLHSPQGEHIVTTVKWQLLSAGSSIFQVKQRSGQALFSIQVRILPVLTRTVTVVTFSSGFKEGEELLPQLGQALRRIIVQHQVNLRALETHGINPKANATIEQPYAEPHIQLTTDAPDERPLADPLPSVEPYIAAEPRNKTVVRASEIDEIKRNNPDYTMNEVAFEYSRLHPDDTDSITEETVRNAYRAVLKKQWPGSKSRTKRSTGSLSAER